MKNKNDKISFFFIYEKKFNTKKKMNKILCIGDPHIKSESLAEFEVFEEKLYTLIEQINPSLIVVLGDILHTHEKLNTLSLNKASSFIDKLRKKALTFVLVGNHDMIKNTEYLTTNHWLNMLKEWSNVVIVDKVIHYTFITQQQKKKELLFLPYVSTGLFKQALDTINNSFPWKNADLIFAHQEFKGCKMGPIVSVLGDEWNDSLPHVISGHIHSNQTISNIYYPGSALQNAFGESEKNIIPIIWFENVEQEQKQSSPYILEEVDLGLPRKKIISVSLENIESVEIKTEQGKRTRLTVKGTYEEFKVFKNTTKYKELSSKGVTIAFRKEIEKIVVGGGGVEEMKDEMKDELKDELKDESIGKKRKREDMISIETSFDELLFDLVKKEENEKLYALYTKIVKN